MKIIVFLIFSLCFLCAKDGFSQTNQDSLRSILRQDIGDEKRAAVLQQLGTSFHRIRPDSVYYYHRMAYALGKKIDHAAIYGRSAQMLGFFFRSKELFDSAFYYNNISEEVFRLENDSINLAKLLIQKGNLLKAADQLDSAAASFVEAGTIFQLQEQPRMQVYAISSLAMIRQSLGQYEEAMDYYNQALELSGESENHYAESVILNNLGGILHLTNQPDKALDCYIRSRKIKENIKDLNGLIFTNNNIGAIYLEKKNYDSALYYLDKAGNIMEETGRKDLQVTRLHNYSIIYRNLSNYRLSGHFLDSAKAIILKKGSLEKLKKNYKHRYKLDSAKGDFKSAFAALKTHIMYKDSLSGVDMQSRIAEIETRYETDQKNNEIATLTKQAQIDDLKIREQKFWLFSVIFLVILIAAAGILITRQRSLKTRFRIGAMEQKFLRSQMNPHFIFNALASIQKYMMIKDTVLASAYLAKFGKLMRQILEHSREEFITLSDEIDTLQNYLDIQKLRFGDRLEYNITLSDDLDASRTRIPPMFAQPFIENALEHGIYNIEEGRIDINFRKEGDLVRVEILDNGRGLAVKAKERSHNSLATRITQERLQIISGAIRKKLEYSIENRRSGQDILGTIVKLTVPCREY